MRYDPTDAATMGRGTIPSKVKNPGPARYRFLELLDPNGIHIAKDSPHLIVLQLYNPVCTLAIIKQLTLQP